MKKDSVKNKSKGFIKEFKEFISRGNVIDLAVGVIIGAAFGKIITSLVDDILMPIIGVIIGGIDFSELSFNVGNASIMYGAFVQNVIDFLIVALCVFIIIKLVNKLSSFRKKEEEAKEEAPLKSDEVVLLEEIRDLLKKRK